MACQILHGGCMIFIRFTRKSWKHFFLSLSFFHFVLDHFKEGGLEKRQNTVLASIIIIQAIITICFSLSSSAKHTFRGLYFNEGWKKCLLHIFFFLKSKHQCSFPMNMHDSTDKMTVECLSLSIWPLLVKKKNSLYWSWSLFFLPPNWWWQEDIDYVWCCSTTAAANKIMMMWRPWVN